MQLSTCCFINVKIYKGAMGVKGRSCDPTSLIENERQK